MTIYDDCEIINIYETKSGNLKGRKRIYLLMPDGTRKMMNYSRYLMERELNQELPRSTLIRYKDGDITNHNIDNLIIEECPRLEFTCAVCKRKFKIKEEKLNSRFNKPLGKYNGPYCSLNCYRKAKDSEVVTFTCPQCKKEFKMSGQQLKYCRRNHKDNKHTGPFCSTSCSNKYVAARNPYIHRKKLANDELHNKRKT